MALIANVGAFFKPLTLRLLLVAVAGFMTTACGSDQPLQASDTAQTYPKAPGLYQQVLQSRSLRCTIFIPDGYTDAQPTPLILALHFGGEVSSFYGGFFWMCWSVRPWGIWRRSWWLPMLLEVGGPILKVKQM